jgi:hypothetical protein
LLLISLSHKAAAMQLNVLAVMKTNAAHSNIA